MVPRISEAVFSLHEWMGKNAPVIITNALADWNLEDCWSPAALGRLLKHRRAIIRTSSRRSFDYSPTVALNESTVEVDFLEATKRIVEERNQNYVYLMQQSIPQLYPELMKVMTVPRWIRNEPTQINLWFGRDAITPLHFDTSNNLFSQAYGKKDFTLFSPFDTPFLDPYPASGGMPHLSRVDLENPDATKHPEFSRASAIKCSLEPGELLYLPAFWWHGVRSNGVTISVNFWWPPQVNQFFECPNSSRGLPHSYRQNRLTQLNQLLLRPNGLTLLQGATLMASKGRTWEALVLALAAFDEISARICRGKVPLRELGCSLEKLSEDLTPTCLLLAEADAISFEHRQAIRRLPELAALAATNWGGAGIDRRAVESVIAAVSALTELAAD